MNKTFNGLQRVAPPVLPHIRAEVRGQALLHPIQALLKRANSVCGVMVEI